jgi:hypothetical protein
VTPSTDPDERNYRIRLLPRVTTPMRQRQRHRQTYLLQLTWRAWSGTVSGTRFAGACSPWPVPFPPSPPPPVARLGSETSAVLRNCPTSCTRASSAYVCETFPTRPATFQPQADTGSPGSRARCFRTCLGSLTSREPFASRDSDASDVAFRFLRRRRLPEVALFRGSIPSLHVPLSTLRPLLTEFTA